MLDPRHISNDPEAIKANLQRRAVSSDVLSDIDRIVALSTRRSELLQEVEELRSQRNALSKEIGALFQAGRRDEAEAAKAKVQAGKARTEVLEHELAQVERDQQDALLGVPNLVHPDVPAGKDDSENLQIRKVGTPREFDFEVQAHVEVGERLGIVDFERAAKLSGARFWVLRGAGARLERALVNYFLDLHTSEHGYTELMVPYLVQEQAMVGTGQLPKFGHDMFRIEGQLNGSPAYLIPTAEVPVTNLHSGELLSEEELPLKYACFTPCFRSEAGAHGRDVRGLMRVHQFHKVELVHLTAAHDSERAHLELLGHAETVLQRLELPYRVELLCGGDTGFSAHKCYDLMVWLPSQGAYREVSSVSNFWDYQARRMGTRYRPLQDAGSKTKTQLVHTLNGSGLAVGRTVVAILENNQQRDGSVVIPEVLRPYMGGQEVLLPPQG